MQRVNYRAYRHLSTKILSTAQFSYTSNPTNICINCPPVFKFAVSDTSNPQPNHFRYAPQHDVHRLEKFRYFVRIRDDEATWNEYERLKASQQLQLLTSQDFSNLLQSLKPRRYDLSSPWKSNLQSERELFYSRVMEVKKSLEFTLHKLSINDYAHLLDCARAGSFESLARQVWQNLLASGIKPDLYCYNTYIATLGGIDSLKLPPKGVSEPQNTAAANSLLVQMMENNVHPSSATFDIFLLIRSKDNDIDGINDILKDIYGLSLFPDENGSHVVKSALPKHHPQAPTPHTLLALAVAYGYHGMIAAALKSVELVSKTYDIKYPEEMWAALLLWAMIRSMRVMRDICRHEIPPGTVRALWDLMRSPKFDVTPTSSMYSLVIKDEIRRFRATPAEELLLEFAQNFGMEYRTFAYLERNFIEIIKIHNEMGRIDEANRVANNLENMKQQWDTGEVEWWKISETA